MTMPRLLLLRHLKSEWNKENRFTGWVDVPLARDRTAKGRELTKKIFKFRIDAIYSSPLFRNQDSVIAILEYFDKKYPVFIHLDKGKMKDRGHFKEISRNYIPVYITEALNERYYGKLQGLNKEKIIKKYGAKRVRVWRRSFDVPPPGGETLKDVYKRVLPFYRKYIKKDLKKRRNVLVVASHNSLRALIKHIEKISDKDVINLEVPFAGLIEYEFDKFLKLKKKKIL
jgi:2,3-bisphosphoglycerate-dependent phosphoglycerate mutase